ncbi:MAG: glycosyltransferase family 9 protein, partial [Chloroflexota bacterium]|nr:glycosyltransferase family 9 protein [Chloroflexota bacterium]
YAQLSDMIVSKLGAEILILSGKDQGEIATAIANCMEIKPLLAPDDASIEELAALMARCDLVVSSDSAPMHIAAAVGTPTVAIFSNVSHRAYHPYLSDNRYRVVREDIPCSPCAIFGTMPPCPYQYKCINSLSVDRVFDAVRALWLSVNPK